MRAKSLKTVVKFMDAWVSGRTAKMFKKTQMTWKSENKESDLEELFEGLKLESYEIIGSRSAGDCAMSVAVKMEINGETVVSAVNVIFETSAKTPDENGVPGVNPISVLKYKS